MLKKITLLFFAISGILFLYSLTQPVFLFSQNPAVEGYTVLFFGWFGFLTGNPGWLANWFFISAITTSLLGHRKTAISLASAAILFSLDGFRVKEWYFTEAAGTPVQSLGTGFYIWVTAICLTAVGTLFSNHKWIE